MQTPEQLLNCPDCGTPNFTRRGLAAHKGNPRCLEIQAQSPQLLPEPQTAEPTFLAVLTGYDAVRDQDPLLTAYDSDRYIEAQKEPTVWWLHVLFNPIRNEALGEARHALASGGGQVTQFGAAQGFQPGKPYGAPKVAPAPATAPLAVVPPVNLTPASQDTILGTQLTEQYQKAIGGIREVLIFGAMMIKLEGHISCVRTRTQDGRRLAKGDGLKSWLETHAPQISRPSAYRFLDLAEGLRTEFSLGSRVDLQWLLTVPPEEITDEALLKKRAQIFEFIEGKSQRQLLLAFETGRHGAGGGHDPSLNNSPELTPEEINQKCYEACKKDITAFAKRGVLLLKGQKYTAPTITDAERDSLVEMLRGLADQIEAYNGTPVHKRTPTTGLLLLEQKASAVTDETAPEI